MQFGLATIVSERAAAANMQLSMRHSLVHASQVQSHAYYSLINALLAQILACCQNVAVASMALAMRKALHGAFAPIAVSTLGPKVQQLSERSRSTTGPAGAAAGLRVNNRPGGYRGLFACQQTARQVLQQLYVSTTGPAGAAACLRVNNRPGRCCVNNRPGGYCVNNRPGRCCGLFACQQPARQVLC